MTDSIFNKTAPDFKILEDQDSIIEPSPYWFFVVEYRSIVENRIAIEIRVKNTQNDTFNNNEKIR